MPIPKAPPALSRWPSPTLWRARTAPVSDFIATVAGHTPPGQTHAGIERAAVIDLAHRPADVGELLGTGQDATAPDTVPWRIGVAGRHLGSYDDACWTAAAEPVPDPQA